MAKEGKRSIVIRKEEVVEGGHHGGAWKVAYADFVTAMMAFFLLMWLLNATTEQQKRGIADYFSPSATIARSPSGFGLPFGGRTPNMDGSLVSDRGVVQVGKPAAAVMATEDDPDETTPASPHQLNGEGKDGSGPTPRPTAGSGSEHGTNAGAPGARARPLARQAADPALALDADAENDTPATARTAAALPPEREATDQDVQAELDRRERASFEQAAQQIRDAVRADPALAELAKQLKIDITPDGLRIQLLDEERTPMFASGSAALNERARAVLAKVGGVLARLPQAVSIAGHTDAAPYKGGERTNWDLSADRANATRRLLIEGGLQDTRIRSVSGMADRDPLLPEDRMAPANRRIAITVLHEGPPPRPLAAAGGK